MLGWDDMRLTVYLPHAHILLKMAKLNSITQQNPSVFYSALTHDNSLSTFCLSSSVHWESILSFLFSAYLVLSKIWVSFLFMDFLLKKYKNKSIPKQTNTKTKPQTTIYLAHTIQTMVLGKKRKRGSNAVFLLFDLNVWATDRCHW